VTNPPPHPGQPYAGQAGPAQAPDGRRRNRAGLSAAILVAIILVLQTISSFLSGAILRASSGSFELYATYTAATVIIQGLLAVAAIILGAIGLAARDRPKALAGMGLGGGIVVLWSILSGQLSNLLLYAVGG
jgi:hypothetical protein